MTHGDIPDVPDSSASDKFRTLVKVALSVVPYLGGPASELFTALMEAPLEQRRDEWRETIGKKLLELEEKMEDFQPESLSEDHTFITVLLQASQAAMKTHQEEKLEALRNAVINCAIHNAPIEDVQRRFIRFVDTFTSWHLQILTVICDRESWSASSGGVLPPPRPSERVSELLEKAWPELQGQRSVYEQWVRDLVNSGLAEIYETYATPWGKEMGAPTCTPLGRKF